MSDSVQITIKTGYSSCEDCGIYQWGSASISIDGREIKHLSWDGHLGGTIQGPDYDLAEFLSVVLEAVCVKAEVSHQIEDEG